MKFRDRNFISVSVACRGDAPGQGCPNTAATPGTLPNRFCVNPGLPSSRCGIYYLALRLYKFLKVKKKSSIIINLSSIQKKNDFFSVTVPCTFNNAGCVGSQVCLNPNTAIARCGTYIHALILYRS